MINHPVIVLGAGATKACGGPLTNEILPAALNGEMEPNNPKTLVADREQLLDLTRDFLCECFNVPVKNFQITENDCPSLCWVLSMLQRSIEQNMNIGDWKGDHLIKAKRAVEYSIFAVIEAALKGNSPNKHLHRLLLEPLYKQGIEPSVISLNYDVIIDNAMFALGESYQTNKPPNYGVEFSTQQYFNLCKSGTFGHLLKIHGSLNWLYCNKCNRIDLFVSDGMRAAKALDELFNFVPYDDAYSCRGTPCRNKKCNGFVSPILVTPTYIKDYENQYVESLWKRAEKVLKRADRVVIIGYSMPTDDIEVALLLKRGLDHLPREKITVVEYVQGDEYKPFSKRMPLENHSTGLRFRSLFGPNIDWQTSGFEGWLKDCNMSNRSTF